MKIPVKPLVDKAKKNGPRLIKQYGPSLLGMIPKDSLLKNTPHHRKERYNTHVKETLQNLDSYNREQLIGLELEIEEFLLQIEDEKANKRVPLNPRINKWNDNWKNILRQVSAKRKNKDYIEYIKIYNNPDYHSEYFVGYEGHIKKYKELIRNEEQKELIDFIISQTGKSEEEINRVIF